MTGRHHAGPARPDEDADIVERRTPISLGVIGCVLAMIGLASPASADDAVPTAPALTTPESAAYVDWGDTAPMVGQQVSLHVDFAPAEEGQTVQLQRYDSGLRGWRTLATGQVGDLRLDLDNGAQVGSFDTTIPTYLPGLSTYRAVALAHGDVPETDSFAQSYFVSMQAHRVTSRYSDGDVVVGTPVKVSGRASRIGAGETVVLQRRNDDGGWSRVDSTQTRVRGRYTIFLANEVPGVERYRVVAPGHDGLVSSTKRITVDATEWTPGDFPPAPPRPESDPVLGDPDDYEFLYDPTPRWNPCLEIGYRINAAEAPPTGIADVQQALAQVSMVTGLRFTYRGTTAVIPGNKDPDGPAAFPSDTDLVVAWATDEQSSYLPPDPSVAGQGGAAYSDNGYVDQDGVPTRMYYKGVLVMNAETTWLTPGFGDGSSTGKVLMHELGHVVGLAHVDQPDELMYPTLGSGPTRWGAGDLTGLGLLGAGEGCLYDASGAVATRTVPPSTTSRIIFAH